MQQFRIETIVETELETRLVETISFGISNVSLNLSLRFGIKPNCTIFAKKASKEAGYSDLICIFANSQVLFIFSVTLRQAKCLA